MAPDARTKLEQIRKNKRNQQKNKQNPGKNNDNGNVRDLRQIIAKKSERKNIRSPDRTAHGRISKARPISTSGIRDLRDTNRKLASRRNLSQTRDKNLVVANTARRVESRPTRINSTKIATRSAAAIKKSVLDNQAAIKIGKKIFHQQQYYVPPHMQRNQPQYIVSGPATTARKPNLSMDSVHKEQQSTSGASILISNLTPEATQSDIINIFGNVGIMTAVNIINQTTALVTYQDSSDAVRAVKFYNNRLLDGKPMLVNMMPNNI